MKNHLSVLSLAILSCLQVAHASPNYPEGFEDFFAETQKSIQVVIAGERDGVEVDAFVSYDIFRIESGSADYHTIEHFLMQAGLTDAGVKQILSSLSIGVTTDEGCSERLERCVLQTTDGHTKYVFDFDGSVLKIFVPANLLSRDDSERQYQSPINQHNALVNYGSVYAFTDLDGHDQITVNDKAVIGLPLGHVYIDSQYHSQNSELDIYSALYDAEYQSTRLQVGYDRYNPAFNSTDYLTGSASYDGEVLRIGSSSNLVKGSNNAQQRIYFYAPQNGQLEVYRDDRLVLNKAVSEGKQFVSYADLPKGAYQATLLLKVAGEVIVRETRQVVNNNQFSLNVYDFDYLVSAGKLENANNDTTDNKRRNYDGKYASVLGNVRATENLMIGGGVTSDVDDQYYQLGGTFLYGNQGRVEYVGGQFSSHDRFQSIRLAHAPFFVDYQELSLSKERDEYRLSQQLYGDNSFQTLGVGIDGNILGGSGYLRYNWNQSDAFDDGYDNVANKTISGGWSHDLPKGRVNLNAEYNYDGFGDYDFRTTATYRLPISELFSTQSSVQVDNDGFSSNTNYLNMNARGDNWNSNTSLGAKIDRDNQMHADLSSSASMHTSKFNANSYVYLNDEGTTNFSGTISGTQILSSSGLDFTNEKSHSFLKVNTNNQSGDSQPIKLMVKKEGKYNKTHELTDSSTIVKLDDFSDLRISLDAGISNVHIDGGKHLDTFALPGTLYTLEPNITALLSRVVILDDIHNNPIEQLACLGDGCVSVEPLTTDGVFRVNYKSGAPYQLVSRKGLCVVNAPTHEVQDYTTGYCLPGIENEEKNKWGASSVLLERIDRSDLMVYLGRFRIGKEANKVKARLNEHHITYKSIDVGGDSFIYVEDKQEFSQLQKELLKELDAYVLRRNTELDLFTFKTELGNKDEV
ncbi:hypothetical protein CGI23_24215 [Vibrio parahaemolyticus]|uniref:TcfC E-set like domain-containing protein n=1 Tax=Vibrio parahaemolyticus TaxID=670 RepID=UPI00111E1592|nr:TcfC E-set like domain-containing protein [Vibrio parahaemolyticus]TOK18361.1 hypothetical protein CGI23_24215 [Vibrio parahaemolyticus]